VFGCFGLYEWAEFGYGWREECVVRLLSVKDGVANWWNALCSIVRRGSKIKWHDAEPCDVLIYDTEGADVIQSCMPVSVKSSVLNVRDGILLISSVRFFLFGLVGYSKYKSFRSAWHYAVIKTLSPKVVITFIDNNPGYYLFKEIFPDITLMAVQNGTRWDLSAPRHKALKFDHYFSFGYAEGDIVSAIGGDVARLCPIGSLRAQCFLDQCRPSSECRYDICHISQYTPLPYSMVDEWQYEWQQAYFSVEKRMFEMIAGYAQTQNLRLCVALRQPMGSAYSEEERSYFSVECAADLTYVPHSAFSSYDASWGSVVTTTISSTLGYEMMGLGCRVLFAKDIPCVDAVVRHGAWAENFNTFKLPELQRLRHLYRDELCFKIDALRYMSDKDYIDYSRDARRYYMNFNAADRPSDVIATQIHACIIE